MSHMLQNLSRSFYGIVLLPALKIVVLKDFSYGWTLADMGSVGSLPLFLPLVFFQIKHYASLIINLNFKIP